eukprot:450794-Prorocentrum_minimum.AAC.1
MQFSPRLFDYSIIRLFAGDRVVASRAQSCASRDGWQRAPLEATKPADRLLTTRGRHGHAPSAKQQGRNQTLLAVKRFLRKSSLITDGSHLRRSPLGIRESSGGEPNSLLRKGFKRALTKGLMSVP